MLWTFKIRIHERGLLYKNGDFARLLAPGRHWVFGLRVRVERVSVRDAHFKHKDLEVIAKSGELEGLAEVLDLMDHERALVWVDGRFERICAPGLHAFWTVFHKVRHEVLDAREIELTHRELPVILDVQGAVLRLERVEVAAESVGLLFVDGRHRAVLEPGLHALWKGQGRVKVQHVDRREQMLDIAGQDVMTADKVTVRLNAVVTYRVTDPLAAATRVEDFRQALYRDAQLALRDAISARELDVLLSEKGGLVRELGETVGARARSMGLEVSSFGLRDLILPGEMKALMNRVTEAKKAAEANLIARREETAAMRSQANTAKILESNPTLMKLKELEVLEKVADQANLSVVLSEGGLADRVLKLV